MKNIQKSFLILAIAMIPFSLFSCLTIKEVTGGKPIVFFPYSTLDTARILNASYNQENELWRIETNSPDSILIDSAGNPLQVESKSIHNEHNVYTVSEPEDGNIGITSADSERISGIQLSPSFFLNGEKSRFIYHVYIGHFENGNPSNDHVGLRWMPDGYIGGDLQGLLERKEYFEELGINTLYLSPVFPSPSVHGFDVTNYYGISEAIGIPGNPERSSALLKELVLYCHANGIDVILDIPLNHCSVNYDSANGNPGGYEIKTTGPEHIGEYFFDQSAKIFNYWNFGDSDTREFIIDVAAYWIREYDIDGFRLDYALAVPNDFWVDFHNEISLVNDDLFLFAEIWPIPIDDLDLLGRFYDMSENDSEPFDTMYDFPMHKTMQKVFARNASAEFLESVLQQETAYYTYGAVPTYLLDNHDLNRFLALCGSEKKLINAFTFICTLSGHIYIQYGTETGLRNRDISNELGPSENGRLPMPWNTLNTELIETFKELIELRNSHPSLYRGGRIPVHVDKDTLIMLKRDDTETALVGVNTGRKERTIILNDPAIAALLSDLHLGWGTERPVLIDGVSESISWRLPANSTTILFTE